MTIFLDSADPAAARAAAELGFVRGITTNPTLIAAHGAPSDVLDELLDVWPGPLFYQPTFSEPESAEAEARAAHGRAPDRVVIKLPAQLELFALAARLAGEGIDCAITALYSPAQYALASAANARWVIPYVDRSRRLEPDLPPVVRRLAMLTSAEAMPAILAASIKTPEQAVAALADGARAVSAPLAVIAAMAGHPLTDAAVEQFADVVRVREQPATCGTQKALSDRIAMLNREGA
jgi:transaldolase